MCLFRKKEDKKSKDELILKDRELITRFNKLLDSMIIKWEDEPEIKPLLVALSDELKYTPPKSDYSAFAQDEKINSLLESIDTETEASLQKKEYNDVKTKIKEIRVIIKNR